MEIIDIHYNSYIRRFLVNKHIIKYKSQTAEIGNSMNNRSQTINATRAFPLIGSIQ